jgi:uroporphyrinogen decarboxylase
MIKNDLYLKALRGETVERPPVWMMRQAGRYLPEFIALRDKYDFFTRCQTPELASEITVQPIRRFPLDAAILFSDILVVPQAMGIDFKMKESVGPWLDNPIRTMEHVQNVVVPDVNDTLGYVFDAIELTLQKLDNEIPLIGFAGSPWTILCYCVEGKGSKAFDIAKSFCFTTGSGAFITSENYRYNDCLSEKKSRKRSFCSSGFRFLGRNAFSGRLSGIFMEIYQPDC